MSFIVAPEQVLTNACPLTGGTQHIHASVPIHDSQSAISESTTEGDLRNCDVFVVVHGLVS
jgi:hypothetical protein